MTPITCIDDLRRLYLKRVPRMFGCGLGALGAAGVTTALELIRRELDLTMVLCGVRTIAEIDRRVLHQP